MTEIERAGAMRRTRRLEPEPPSHMQVVPLAGASSNVGAPRPSHPPRPTSRRTATAGTPARPGGAGRPTCPDRDTLANCARSGQVTPTDLHHVLRFTAAIVGICTGTYLAFIVLFLTLVHLFGA